MNKLTITQLKYKLLAQLHLTMKEYEINSLKWINKELTIESDTDSGYAYFIHTDDINKHMTKQRKMEFPGFFFNRETGEIIQGNYPLLS
jgi:hypothetical protein